jgi:hypothetical protein
MKKRTLVAAAILSFALAGVASSQSTNATASNDTHYTQAQLKQMLHEAHTPEQYNALAGYFAGRHDFYAQQASEEKAEWMRRSQNVMVVAAKYPRPVDSARNLYEYYSLKASEAADNEAKYRQLASSATPPPAR